MRIAESGCRGLADPGTLANDDGVLGPHPDANAHGVAAGDGLAGLALEQTLAMDHLAVPAVIAKDPVGLVHDKPALDIREALAVLLFGLDAGRIKTGRQLFELALTKAGAHRVETVM